MAFTQNTFATVGAQSAPTLTVYAYNTSDSVATVTAAGYFGDKASQFNEGDIINGHIGGASAILTINASLNAVLFVEAGSVGENTKEVTGNYTQLATDKNLIITGPSIFTMIESSAAIRSINVKSKDVGGNVTATPSGSDKVGGASTLVIPAGGAQNLAPITLDWEVMG